MMFGPLIAALERWGHAVNSFTEHLHEFARQDALTSSLGQVTCSSRPSAHDAENLPCRDCGAAL